MMPSAPSPTPSHARHAVRSLQPKLVQSGAVLVLLVILAGPAAAQTATCLKEPCPRQDTGASSGTYGNVQLSRSLRELPLRVSGVSGGPADAPLLRPRDGGPCSGFTGVLPDHVLVLPHDLAGVRLEVAAQGATSLVVHGPGGWLCSDGGGTRNRPALEGTFAAGTWRIWVASDAPTAYHNYVLDFGPPAVASPRPDRTRPVSPAPAPPVVVAPAPHPDRGPRYDRRPPRVAAPAGPLVVRGQFEAIDIRFEGATIGELHRQCTAFVGQARNLNLVDDVVFHGQAWRNATGFWSNEALCAMVALNARPQGASAEHAIARGHLEGVPFEIHGTTEDLRRVLRQYIPVAVNMTWADDLEVNGQTRRNRTGFWNLDEVIMLIVSLSDD